MTNVLIATDSDLLAKEIVSVLPHNEFDVRIVSTGQDVLLEAKRQAPDIAILDLQIGNMGGVAISFDLKLEASAERLPNIPVLLLLDRRADVFIAKRSQASGFVIKPLDPMRLRKAVAVVVAGGSYEDTSYRPLTTVR